MSFKKILIYFLLILLTKELYAQNKDTYEKSAICLQNIKTNKLKIIHIHSKIKYWLYNSDKTKKGRILGIKDSSIIVKGEEIKLKDISKIGVRKGTTGPFIIAGAATIIFGLTPIFIVSAVLENKNYDMTKRWKFLRSINPVIDSSKLEKYKKNEKLQNDTSSTISFSLNPLNTVFNQCTLEMGYDIKNKFSIGVGGGLVKADLWWNKNHALYDGTDDDYPAGFYNGWLLMMNFKKLNITRNHWYFETSLFYKYLYYDHIHFINTFGDQDPDVEWIRSEVTNVYGIKFLMGKRIYLTNHFIIEPIFGVSIRERFRTYITYWANELSEHLDYSNGVCHRNQIFPGMQAGLLLTFGNFKIK